MMRALFPATRSGCLLLTCLLATAAGLATGGEANGVRPRPGEPGPEVARLFKKLKLAAVPPGTRLTLRYPTVMRRRLRYDGTVREMELARSGSQLVAVSSKTYSLRRVELVQPLGSGLAQVWSYSESSLAAARQAGRDDLDLFQARPSGGRRISAIMRRLGGRGLEPAGGDFGLQRRLSPVAEMPRLPGGELVAGGEIGRTYGEYLATWKLESAARLQGRKCWVLSREVGLKRGSAPGAAPVTARSEYVVSADELTVLGVTSRWTALKAGGGLVRERALELRLAGESSPRPEELSAESTRIERSRELLRAISSRNVNRARRLLAGAREARCSRVVIELTARFLASEQALGRAAGGARRIELVPEDTFAFVRAPRKLDPQAELRPVVFLHGAAARAETYFKDWSRRAGDKPLLLIFPQSRDWTWNAQSDGAVIGSLLDALGRTYRLERKRLVFAGHASGGELAMILAYGAEFPGYETRGVIGAGALLSEGIRRRAYEDKPTRLLARLRSVDAHLFSGLKDRKVRPEKVRNLANWLTSYNPKGVSLTLTRDVALRYTTEWTPLMIDWILALPARPAPKSPARR